MQAEAHPGVPQQGLLSPPMAWPSAVGPLSHGGCTSPGGFLCFIHPPKRVFFFTENQQPSMEALLSTEARKVEGEKFVKDVPCRDKEPLAPVGAGKKAICTLWSFPVGCKESLHSCLCSGWGVSQKKMHRGLTGVKDCGRMARRDSVSP